MVTEEEAIVEHVQPPSRTVVLKQILTLGLGDYIRRLGQQRSIIRETFANFSDPKEWMHRFWGEIRSFHVEGGISTLSQGEINKLVGIIRRLIDKELVHLPEDPFNSSLHEVVLVHGQRNEGPGILITDLGELSDGASDRILGVALFALYSFSWINLVESSVALTDRPSIDSIRAYRNTLKVLLEISNSSLDSTVDELGRFTVDYLDRRLTLGAERRPSREGT